MTDVRGAPHPGGARRGRRGLGQGLRRPDRRPRRGPGARGLGRRRARRAWPSARRPRHARRDGDGARCPRRCERSWTRRARAALAAAASRARARRRARGGVDRRDARAPGRGRRPLRRGRRTPTTSRRRRSSCRRAGLPPAPPQVGSASGSSRAATSTRASRRPTPRREGGDRGDRALRARHVDPLALRHVDVHPGPRGHTHYDLRYLLVAPPRPPPRRRARAPRSLVRLRRGVGAEPDLAGGDRAPGARGAVGARLERERRRRAARPDGGRSLDRPRPAQRDRLPEMAELASVEDELRAWRRPWPRRAPRATPCAPPTRTPRARASGCVAREAEIDAALASPTAGSRELAALQRRARPRARAAAPRPRTASSSCSSRSSRSTRPWARCASAPARWPSAARRCARASRRSPPGSRRRPPRCAATASRWPTRCRPACARATTTRWRASAPPGRPRSSTGAATAVASRSPRSTSTAGSAAPEGDVHALPELRATAAAVIILVRHGQIDDQRRGPAGRPQRPARSPPYGERQARALAELLDGVAEVWTSPLHSRERHRGAGRCPTSRPR